MSVIETGAPASRCAVSSPPKPAPTITTRWTSVCRACPVVMDRDLQVRKILRPSDYVGLSVPVQDRIPNRPIAKAHSGHISFENIFRHAHPFGDTKRLSVEGVLPWRHRRTSME